MNGSESFSSFTTAMSTLSHHHPLATLPDSDPPLLNPNNSNNLDSKPDFPNPTHQSEIPEPYLTITVSNPQKQLESSSSTSIGNTYYITYLITTKTNIPDFGGPHFTVRRRFNDFITLSDRLTESHRGFFIPPRPDKSLVESQVMQKHEFVEQRRYALEKYLRTLGDHYLIRQSDELRVFLQVQGKLPFLPTAPVASRMLDGASKLSKQLFLGDNSVASFQPQEVVQLAKSRWDFLRIIKEMNQAVSNSPPIYQEGDAHFFQIRDRMLNLQNQLTYASKQADLFVKAQQDMSDTMGAFGLSFIKLTKFENQHTLLETQTKRAVHLKNLATSAIKASRLYRELSSSTVKHLDTLHDHVGLMLGVHTAFSDRSSAFLTVQTLTSELDSLYSRVEKLETASSKPFSSDKPNTIKLGVLRESIRVTEDAKSCATREYERINENNRTETERLDRERKVDFKNMLKGFVLNQVAFSEKLGKEWANVADDTSGYAKHNG